MIDHLGLQAADVPAAVALYTTVFAPAGLREAMRYETPGGPVVGMAGPDGHPQLWLSPLAEGADRPVHLALRAPSREAVDEVFALAREQGAEVLHEPRVWPEYHPGYQKDPVLPTPRRLGRRTLLPPTTRRLAAGPCRSAAWTGPS